MWASRRRRLHPAQPRWSRANHASSRAHIPPTSTCHARPNHCRMRVFISVALLALSTLESARWTARAYEDCDSANGDSIPNIILGGESAVINCSRSGNLVHDVAIRNLDLDNLTVYSSFGKSCSFNTDRAPPGGTRYYPREHNAYRSICAHSTNRTLRFTNALPFQRDLSLNQAACRGLISLPFRARAGHRAASSFTPQTVARITITAASTTRRRRPSPPRPSLPSPSGSSSGSSSSRSPSASPSRIRRRRPHARPLPRRRPPPSSSRRAASCPARGRRRHPAARLGGHRPAPSPRRRGGESWSHRTFINFNRKAARRRICPPDELTSASHRSCA